MLFISRLSRLARELERTYEAKREILFLVLVLTSTTSPPKISDASLVLIETRTGRAKPSFALYVELAVFIVQRFLNYNTFDQPHNTISQAQSFSL